MNDPATFAATTPPSGATAVCALPLDEIVPNPGNPRKHFDETYLVNLAATINDHGVIQPITVRPLPFDAMMNYNRFRKAGDDSQPRYEIVVGECRWRASRLAGKTDIPAFWRDLDDKQVLEIQVIENLQRRDVHPIEEAEGYQVLLTRHGYTADTLAVKIGKSRAYVYARLKLTALCPTVREAFYSGKLDASTALLIARIPGEALQKKATKEVTCGYDNQPLSYRNAQIHLRNRYTLSLKQATFRPDDAALLPAAGACSACPKLSGNFHDLFNDITDADVCTDPDCFEAKRQARRDQLIAGAEQRKIPVLLGEVARDIWRDSIEYVSLDAEVDDDAEGRTYRQILGDKVAPAALIEAQYGQKELMECAGLTVLEKALKKAGWKPAAPEPVPARPGETAQQHAARQAEIDKAAARRAQEDQRKEQAAAESKHRQAALDAGTAALHALTLDTDKTTEDLLYLLAEAWFRHQMDCNELADLEAGIRAHLDAAYTLPDEFDDTTEIPRAIALLRKAPLARVVAFLLADLVAADECHLNPWQLDPAHPTQSAPHILAQLTRLLGVPFASLTHPASPPVDAAQAVENTAAAQAKDKKPGAKKLKTKANPAPAMPANEAAAPPTTTARAPWPFPIQP